MRLTIPGVTHPGLWLELGMRIGVRAADRLGRVSPALGQCARRSVLLVWWLLTGQIRQQFRAWRQARQAPQPVVERRPVLVQPDPIPDRIHVPIAERPVVSVIIPTYGKADFTLRCLASIASHPPRRRSR